MKQIRVIAESKNKLVLDEDAQKGDWIDLAQINSVDTGLVEKALAAGADKVYQEKLRAAKSEFELQSQKRIAELNARISSFENEKKLAVAEALSKKDSEISDLKDQLAKLNLDVQQLESQMAVIDSTLREEQRLSDEKSEIISSQDEALNTVYYVVGSKKELMNHNIVAKDGVFKGLKIGPGMDKDYFTKVDLRSCNSINLNVKKAQILSNHPSGSYKLVQKGKTVEKIEITDPVKFWENSKILVVVTD